MIKRFSQLLRLAAMALLPALAAGCLPNVTWLPDSSGFVYTGGPHKDALYLYDLEKKEPRVLVEKGAGPAWPAVSPDGKRIAVALRKQDGATVSLEVVVFDRDGKELQHSEKMKWAKHGESPSQMAAQAFWVPGQDKLLLSIDHASGFYDLKTKSLTKLDVDVATFGSSPIRPDGKGFLALLADTLNPGYFFVDWEGKRQKIEIAPMDIPALTDNEKNFFAFMLFYPLIHSSHWAGPTAVVSWDGVRLTLDSEKFSGAVEHFKPAHSADEKVIQHQIQLAGGGLVRAVELTGRYKPVPPSEPRFGSYRVEVVKQGAKEPRTLMDGAGFFMIYPSPDNKKVVVKCSRSLDALFRESKPDQDVLFLIDSLGNVADKIDLIK